MTDSQTGQTKSAVNMNMIMFLDTATTHTGYAFYEWNQLSPRQTPEFILITYGVFSCYDKDWRQRTLNMTAKISNVIRTTKPRHLVQEFPYYQGGLKGIEASRRGDTIKLSYLCGRIDVVWEYYCAKVLADTETQLWPVTHVKYQEWNGQLAKKHTCKRLETYFGIVIDPKSKGNNAADAIMMGKHHVENVLDSVVSVHHNADRVDL